MESRTAKGQSTSTTKETQSPQIRIDKWNGALAPMPKTLQVLSTRTLKSHPPITHTHTCTHARTHGRGSGMQTMPASLAQLPACMPARSQGDQPTGPPIHRHTITRRSTRTTLRSLLATYATEPFAELACGWQDMSITATFFF